MFRNHPVVLLIFALLLNSCAFFIPSPVHNKQHRDIASDDLPTLEELFVFKSSGIQNQHDQLYTLKNNIEYNLNGLTTQFILDEKMAGDEAFKLHPTVEKNQYVLKIYHSQKASFDSSAVQELTSFLGKFKRDFLVSYSLMELYYNARHHDISSMAIIARMRKESAFNDSENLKYWENVQDSFEKAERIHSKKVRAETDKRKAVMDALDKATDNQQFRTLVANNDRKGAAKLIRAYLPWELMPPFEKLFWENQLAVMADPLPLEQRVLMYRGINDDLIQVAVEAGKTLTKEEAIKEQKIFLLSTMMTKNQGTWNRRLRSLTAMYDKFIATTGHGDDLKSEYTRGARISTMFSRHASEPKGSPFLSLTPKFSVASNFGSSRNSLYFMDPRLFHYNFASHYSSEIEFLLPLITFPDDLAAVWDYKIHGPIQVEEFLKKTAIERLDRELGAGKGTNAFGTIQLNTAKFIKPLSSKGGALPSSSDFYKQNLGVESSKLMKKIELLTDMPCMDLIQLFW